MWHTPMTGREEKLVNVVFDAYWALSLYITECKMKFRSLTDFKRRKHHSSSEVHVSSGPESQKANPLPL